MGGRLGIAGGDYVDGLDVGDAMLIPRHGDPYTQPHRIDHAANMQRLVDAGCDRVLALGSVGGLRRELGVGTFLCPDDFIALHVGKSAFGDRRAHRVAGFDSGWRAHLVDAWASSAEVELLDGGVYWQTIGPRFETPAEIRMIAPHADVVGMTIASECVIAGELGLATRRSASSTTSPTEWARASSRSRSSRPGGPANRERLGAAVAAIVPELSQDQS